MANAFQFDETDEIVALPVETCETIEFMTCDLVTENSIETIDETKHIDLLLPITKPAIPHRGTRKKVPKSKLHVFPYNVICKLFITYQPHTYIGTGFLIDHETILTAGHCVYYKGLWASSITVVPGMNGREKPFGEFYASKLITPRDWTKNSKADLDFALVKLSQKITHLKEFLSLANNIDNFDVKDDVVICGYPSDLESGYYLYQDRGKIDKLVVNQLFYDVDTNGGQSGSPIYNNSKGCVIGIHNYGGNQLNCGTCISLVKKMVDVINGPARLEFEMDVDGKFVSFRSISMSTYREPSGFIGEHIKNVLPDGEMCWQKTVAVCEKLKKNSNSNPTFTYNIGEEQYQANVSLVRRLSPGGKTMKDYVKVVCKQI